MHIDLSDMDVKILALLQENAAFSTAEIAERVGLSQSPCWRRISRLEQAGLIKNRVAVLDHVKLGMEVVVFVTISLSAHGREGLEEFEHEVKKFPVGVLYSDRRNGLFIKNHHQRYTAL